MGYRGDDREGGERWRDRDSRSWSDGGGRGRDGGRDGWNEGRREETGWGPGFGGGDRDRGEHRSHGGGDRGFFERASEGVRSFFGGDGDEGGRGRWDGGEARGRGGRGEHRDNGYGGGPGTLGGGGFGGGWGNQAGESWNRERPGERGWFTDSVGGERGTRPGASGPSSQRPEREEEGSRSGGSGSGGGYSAMTGDYGRGAHLHDPHYADWRQRQIAELDRDYEEYRREHQAKFEQEFGAWRQKRQGQRQLMGGITEKMEVVGSDGVHVGTVDKVRGDRIVLTRSDPNAGGIHHSVPCSWVESAQGKVTLNRTAEQAFAEWRDEDRNRALFERHESGEEGPHMLNRSFSGTYSDDRKD